MSFVTNQIMRAMAEENNARRRATAESQASAKAAFDEAHRAHKLVSGKRRAAAATEAARIAEERRLAQQRTRFDLSVEGQVAAVATSGLAEVDLPAKRDVLAHMLNAAWLPHQEYSPMFNVRML